MLLLEAVGALQTFGQEPDPAKRLRQKEGAKLRELRTVFRGLTMEEVAERMEALGVPVTQQAISLWENGKASPRPHMRVAICKVLDVSPSSIWNLDAEVA